MKPQRIQRKRTKGYRMPEGAISVTRPSLFGNPFVGDRAVEAYREWLARETLGVGFIARMFGCVVTGRLRGIPWASANTRLKATDGSVLERLPELRGKTLACYCSPGALCHADVLLELANQ